MTNKEILKAAKKVSEKLPAAIEQDYINKGQQVPATIIELINVLSTLKKK